MTVRQVTRETVSTTGPVTVMTGITTTTATPGRGRGSATTRTGTGTTATGRTGTERTDTESRTGEHWMWVMWWWWWSWQVREAAPGLLRAGERLRPVWRRGRRSLPQQLQQEVSLARAPATQEAGLLRPEDTPAYIPKLRVTLFINFLTRLS